MPHLAHDLLTSDPEGLARLREMLHGPQASPDAMPDLAERFGVVRRIEEGVPALVRKARRRRDVAPAANLVTP